MSGPLRVSLRKQKKFMFRKKPVRHDGPFGSCCKDLADAMKMPPNSFFNEAENGVLFLTVGYMQTVDGPGWFDQAVFHCPFCGVLLQTRDGVGEKA